MVNRSKAQTFIGFSIRSRALVAGANSIAAIKRAYLIIVCSTASENAKKSALAFAERFHCPLMECKLSLEDIVYKENCKTVAITDKNLAKAITDNQDENFSVISGGNGV